MAYIIRHRQVKVRVVEIDNQPWCALCDISKAEHMGHSGDLKKKLPAECIKLQPLKDFKGRLQKTTLVNMAGLDLLLGSGLKEKIEEKEKLQEQIGQKTEIQQHQMRSIIKRLLDIWE